MIVVVYNERVYESGGVGVKAVIFDLDGTLLDRESSLLSFLEDQLH
ncbi:hypothetical protein [Paenibacillus sp. NAIST15-1]|nr:hypothetical protein [Paenibacillus sp. NAIST15-1]